MNLKIPFQINWKEQFKMRINSSSKSPFSQYKHEIIKLTIMHCILKKYKDRNNQVVYSEWDIGNGKVADVFHRNKENQIGYEVQEKTTKKWKEDTIKKYEEADTDLVIIPISKIPNDLIKIEKEVMKYIL
jgi:hypothetical protein